MRILIESLRLKVKKWIIHQKPNQLEILSQI